MRAQTQRLSVVSENLSNADTHGYKRKLITFANEMDRVEVERISLDRRQGELDYLPAHPLADAAGYVEMSNVNMMVELADAREASHSYEANLTTFKQAGQMYRGLLDLLRR
jgi:flagellar basal-body rod protein FlgC